MVCHCPGLAASSSGGWKRARTWNGWIGDRARFSRPLPPEPSSASCANGRGPSECRPRTSGGYSDTGSNAAGSSAVRGGSLGEGGKARPRNASEQPAHHLAKTAARRTSMPRHFAVQEPKMKLEALRTRVLTRLEGLSWVGPLAVRLSLGDVFLGTGWGKLHNLGQVTSFFTELGIPFPGVNAALVAGL